MGDNLEIRIEQGFGLNPTPEKLINGYLIPWVTGQNPTWNGVVEKAIYGDSFPWEIFSDIESLYHSKMEEKGAIKYTIFAFTRLVRAQNSKRVSRKAGKGTWDGQTGPMKIEDSNTGCIIGQSKMLVFGHSGEANVGHWTMHEYSLSKELVKKSGRANTADLVVCKITKTVKKKDKSDHNTNQSPAAIGYGDRNDDMAPQPESNGEICNLVRFAPETNEGFFNGDYQVQCAQPESYDEGSNYERFAPATSEGFSSEYIGSNNNYQVQAAQPESYDDGSYYARFAPDTNEFLFPANEVPFANPGFDPFAQPNIVPTVQQSDERHAPLQPLEDATVSMKRAAEVEDSDMKRQKCDGKEYSDDDSPDWMTEFQDLFPSDFHQLMEAETRPQPNPDGSGDGLVQHPMITHGANAFDVTVPTEEQQTRFSFGEIEEPERRHGDSFFQGDQQVPSTTVNRRL